MARNRTKILVPLATLAAAGALAVGSGATFTSETGNTVSAVTSGTLTQSNSKADQAIFNLSNMKPGDTVNGSLTLTNTGSLPATFSLTEVSSATEFASPYLSLTVTDVTSGAVVYNGDFGGLVDGASNDLGVWASGAAHQFTFSVKLAQNTPNSEQGHTASATYRWNSVQLDGETFNQ